MVTDIFGRLPLQFGGAFAADSAVCTFGGLTGGGVGLLTQNLNFSYTQSITRLYEVGTPATFYIAGRSQGQGQIARVLGPRPVSAEFYAAYGDVCNAALNTLVFTITTGCEPPEVGGTPLGGMIFGLIGVVLTSISISIQAQDMICNENLSMMYIALLAG